MKIKSLQAGAVLHGNIQSLELALEGWEVAEPWAPEGAELCGMPSALMAMVQPDVELWMAYRNSCVQRLQIVHGKLKAELEAL